MKSNKDNESTRVLSIDEATQLINPGAPVSAEAMKKSPWAARLGFGIGGAAAGFAAGFATSATAGTHKASFSGLAPAAIPEDEMTAEEKADSVIHAREATTIDDPYDLPNSIEVSATETTNTNNNEQAAASATIHVETVNPEIEVEVATPITEPEIEVEVTTPIIEPETITVETGTIPDESDVILENENGIRYGQVDNDMSFGEAFATARAQVGTPGVFVWHGNTYGTYYAEEWNAMSADERGQFLADVNVSDEYNHDVPVEPELKVYDITYTLSADGHLSGVAHITIDGVDVTLRDINGDEIMDVAQIDGHNSNNEILVLDDQNITVEDIITHMDYSQNPVDIEPVDTADMDTIDTTDIM